MDILDTFIQNTKETIAEGYYDAVGKYSSPKISLREKLDTQDFTLITEIKHASPAGEYEFQNINAEPTAVSFKQSGADAISCVVEPKIFKGNLQNIPLAKKAGLPVLFKDFIMQDSQIEAANRLGADVVLLVVKVANRADLDLNALIQRAHDLDLEVLLEAYDTEEMQTALSTEADILGINNRDLQTLQVNLERTEEILSSTELDRPLISESGIKTRADIERVQAAGASGALVGTAIWTAPDLEEKIRELKGGVLHE